MQKSTEANSPKQDKDAEAGSSKKSKGKKGKGLVTDLEVEGSESSGDVYSPLEFTSPIESEIWRQVLLASQSLR